MPIELITLLVLALLLIVSIVFGINMGICALVAAFVLGTQLMDMPVEQILAGFPANIFISIVGIMFLLGVARDNKTMDWIVHQSVALARGRIVLLPWILFALAAITSTLGPSAGMLLLGIGGTLSARHNINPLLTAVMVIHGTQGGAFSPVAPYGVIVNGLIARNGLVSNPMDIYLTVLLFHIVLAVVVFFVLGGRKLIGRRVSPAELNAELGEIAPARLNPVQMLTLAGFVALFSGVLFFHQNIGLLAFAIGLILMFVTPRAQRESAVTHIHWPVALIISGVIVYIAVLEKADAVNWLGSQLIHVGSPLLVALLICFFIGTITAFASTLGTIGILIPLCVPFLLSGDIHVTGTIAAIAICAAVSDVCPFSAYGALALSSTSPDKRAALYNNMLRYTGVLLLIVPPIVWGLLIAPRW